MANKENGSEQVKTSLSSLPSTIHHPLSTDNSELLSLVIVGHVDHGKSTVLGRMLADTGALPEGKLEQVKEVCRRNSRPFEYAFLLDALKDEQAQGITIDAARCFFSTATRKYIIIDAPGHIEFLKNMVTGASRAEAALLVIDANEGVQENSKRHGYLLAMLGIRQVAVVVNKMDLVNYDEDRFNAIEKEYRDFLKQINVDPRAFIPVSGLEGDNVAKSSEHMSWSSGQTVLDILDSFESEKSPVDRPFRMPVQAVYKFTRGGDDRRIIAGTVETGRLKVGDQVIFLPGGKTSMVKSIESFNSDVLPNHVEAGASTGFTLTEQIYVKRGMVATVNGEPKPKISTILRANMFWLGRKPFVPGKEYLLKLGTAKVRMTLNKVNRLIDASSLKIESRNEVRRHEVAECVMKLEQAIAFDCADEISATSRFVIVDDYEIAGGGIIVESLEDSASWVREKVAIRNYRWEKSIISIEKRAEKYNQKPTLVLITGSRHSGKKPTAKAFERLLFEDGKMVYFLGIGNLLYGVDADLKGSSDNFREEHIRRLAEVANLMLDAGNILAVTAIELRQSDLDIITSVIPHEQTKVVWMGKNVSTDIRVDLQLGDMTPADAACKIKSFLQKDGIIFKPF
jgi:bifunctional enzyme CysN/CysC